MAKKPVQYAKLLQVLLWYDEPQVVLLQPRPLEFIIGVATDIEKFQCAFIGAQVSVRQLVDYKLEKIDLRYLFLKPDQRKWWIFDLDNDSDEIPLFKVSGKNPIVDKAAPDPGLFSRFHEEIEIVDVQTAKSAQKFYIDGSWDLGEFSQFYSQVEDIYYIFHSVEEYMKSATPNSRKKAIHDALVRPFRGGGSYVALYNDFANDNDRAARLRVSGIQYHSPGYVEVKALETPFAKTLNLLGEYAKSHEEIKSRYRILHSTLSKNKLLRKEAKTVFGGDLRGLILEQSNELAKRMPGVSFDDLLLMTDNNVLIASKVLLSMERRVERLFQFFDEGRAKHPDVRLT